MCTKGLNQWEVIYNWGRGCCDRPGKLVQFTVQDKQICFFSVMLSCVTTCSSIAPKRRMDFPGEVRHIWLSAGLHRPDPSELFWKVINARQDVQWECPLFCFSSQRKVCSVTCAFGEGTWKTVFFSPHSFNPYPVKPTLNPFVSFHFPACESPLTNQRTISASSAVRSSQLERIVLGRIFSYTRVLSLN